MTNFETVCKLFFEIHDPTQRDGQGHDIGDQYLSAVFYVDENQHKTAQRLVEELKLKGYDVATELRIAEMFWPAEEYHQDYFELNEGLPDCHSYTKRF